MLCTAYSKTISHNSKNKAQNRKQENVFISVCMPVGVAEILRSFKRGKIAFWYKHFGSRTFWTYKQYIEEDGWYWCAYSGLSKRSLLFYSQVIKTLLFSF
jgi:hypothetical protein